MPYKTGSLIDALELHISLSYSKCVLWMTWSTPESKLLCFSLFGLNLCIHIEFNTEHQFQDLP